MLPRPCFLIQGILAFDTPYNGLARPMFVYGAFSQLPKGQQRLQRDDSTLGRGTGHSI